MSAPEHEFTELLLHRCSPLSLISEVMKVKDQEEYSRGNNKESILNAIKQTQVLNIYDICYFKED